MIYKVEWHEWQIELGGLAREINPFAFEVKVTIGLEKTYPDD